jgi:sugar lactone lactonase YvrE
VHFLRSFALLGLVLLAVAITSCSSPTTAKTRGPDDYIFYPNPPSPPRYQFLLGFGEEKDLRGDKGGFASYIVGEDPTSQAIIKPYGIALQNHTVFLCDTIAFAIDQVDLRTGKLRYFRPEGPGRLGKPINVALDDQGNRYVADTAWGMVLMYDKDDRFLGSIGARGTTKPSDVVVHGRRLYVADLQEHCVKVFDNDSRKELYRIPREGEPEEGQIFSPANIAVGPDGKVYVSDMGSFNVKIYDGDGRFLRRLGELGDHVGGMVRPKGVAVDREGRVYVVDAATEVVQVFDPEGHLLVFFGESAGKRGGLVLPAKVLVDYDHVDHFRRYASPDFELEYLVLVTSQYGPNKVSVFGFGHRRGTPPVAPTQPAAKEKSAPRETASAKKP